MQMDVLVKPPVPRHQRPFTLMFGPDGALYLVDYGAVHDFGQSDPFSRIAMAASTTSELPFKLCGSCLGGGETHTPISSVATSTAVAPVMIKC